MVDQHSKIALNCCLSCVDFFLVASKEHHLLVLKHIYNPITAMGFSAMFTFQLDDNRGKHCRHPIAIMWVVDTFGQYCRAKTVKIYTIHCLWFGCPSELVDYFHLGSNLRKRTRCSILTFFKVWFETSYNETIFIHHKTPKTNFSGLTLLLAWSQNSKWIYRAGRQQSKLRSFKYLNM